MSDFQIEGEDQKKTPRPPPPPPPFPPPGTPGSASYGRRGRRKGASFPWPLLILLSLAPVGLTAWILLMPAEQRQKAFDSIPAGSGGRAIAAGITLLVLLALVYLVLPATRAALHGLMRGYQWFFRQRGAMRVLLFPVQFVVWLGWFLMQIVFAIDAVLVLASGLGLVLMAIHVFKPDVFPWLPG